MKDSTYSLLNKLLANFVWYVSTVAICFLIRITYTNYGWIGAMPFVVGLLIWSWFGPNLRGWMVEESNKGLP